MVPDPLLETNGRIDSLTLEQALFKRRYFVWRETDRQMMIRYSWNKKGQITSKEENSEVYLFSYNENGNQTACYRLNPSGNLISREIREWDEQNRISRRILICLDPPSEEIWTYEHDDAGRMTAERKGNKIRVEKYDSEGRLEQEYLYDGKEPDLVTGYAYDRDGRLISVTVKNPEGFQHRKTAYTYDDEGRISSEIIVNSKNRIVKDVLYEYGVTQGTRWLERITWIPLGKKKGKRRPSVVIYRSFTLGENQSRSVPGSTRSVAFGNGIYFGSLDGDTPEGQGVFQFNDSSRYDGNFRKGSMEGPGSLSWPDGRVMKGNFKNGVLEGAGVCIWANGSRYDGEFKNGAFHGTGIFTWPDGTRFEGLFEEGKRTSQGVWERLGDP